MSAALSNIQSSDVLVLNATTTLPLTSCSFIPSVAGSFLQCGVTGDQSSLQGQYGWVFGTHPMEGQPSSTNSVLIGGSNKPPFATLSVWGPDAASSTLAFNVVNSASTTVFAVFDGGNAQLSGTLTQSSDQRLKTNIQSLDASSSLALIDALDPVTFNWIDPTQGSGTQVGFIAQQVQQIFPELVSTTSATALTPGGTFGLNYIGLISPVISAIQALSGEITALEATVAGFADNIVSAHITVTNADIQTANIQNANIQKLCVKKSDGTPVCINGDQLAAVLTNANQTAAGSPTVDAPSTPDTTPPVITIVGDNPAHIHVGDSYADLGASVTDTVDQNLGLKYFLNGALVSNIVIDTSAAVTDTIDYVAADAAGNTATSTRTVIVESPATAEPAPAP
jgi:hypothetical protein